MSCPPIPCPHHRPGGRPVCQSCSTPKSLNDDRGLFPDNSAALAQYLQHPAVRKQATIDTQTLYRQRPIPATVYGEDPTVASNIVNGARPRQLPEIYPYAREIADGDLLFGQALPAPNRQQPLSQPQPLPLPMAQRAQVRSAAQSQPDGTLSEPRNATLPQLRGTHPRPPTQPPEAPYTNGESRRTSARQQRTDSSMLDLNVTAERGQQRSRR